MPLAVTSSPDYQYSALDYDSPQIRLIHLEAAEDFDDPLQIRLECTSLENDPRYNALSYTWGNPSAVDHLFLDDNSVISIAYNASRALRHIRAAVGSIVLWVDAVSINQSDRSERGHQVQLMRRIFSQADMVRVWIDEQLDAGATAVSTLADTHTHLED